MTLLKDFLDFFLHLDAHLFALIQDYGMWIYGILFLIIFVETGLVVMPLLPGDSLLFAAGTFCAGVVKDGETAELNLVLVLILLIIAAILGDGLNYFLGKTIGIKVLQWKIGNRQLVKQKYIDRTLCSDRSHLRSFRCWNWKHELQKILAFQRHWWRYMGVRINLTWLFLRQYGLRSEKL